MKFKLQYSEISNYIFNNLQLNGSAKSPLVVNQVNSVGYNLKEKSERGKFSGKLVKKEIKELRLGWASFELLFFVWLLGFDNKMV